MKFSISFIIPFFNESKYLPKLLNSLELQVLKNINVEIILVDGNSTDNSLNIIETFLENL